MNPSETLIFENFLLSKVKRLNSFTFHLRSSTVCPQTCFSRLPSLLNFRLLLLHWNWCKAILLPSLFRELFSLTSKIPVPYRLTETLISHSSGKSPVSFTSFLIICTHELSFYSLFKCLKSKMEPSLSLYFFIKWSLELYIK